MIRNLCEHYFLGLKLFLFFCGFMLASCKEVEGAEHKFTENSVLNKKEFYLSKMKVKNFQMEINGPCDDALEDTVHERS
jgi:hypothetical protein